MIKLIPADLDCFLRTLELADENPEHGFQPGEIDSVESGWFVFDAEYTNRVAEFLGIEALIRPRVDRGVVEGLRCAGAGGHGLHFPQSTAEIVGGHALDLSDLDTLVGVRPG
jgi:hypothetical protein